MQHLPHAVSQVYHDSSSWQVQRDMESVLWRAKGWKLDVIMAARPSGLTKPGEYLNSYGRTSRSPRIAGGPYASMGCGRTLQVSTDPFETYGSKIHEYGTAGNSHLAGHRCVRGCTSSPRNSMTRPEMIYHTASVDEVASVPNKAQETACASLATDRHNGPPVSVGSVSWHRPCPGPQ